MAIEMPFMLGMDNRSLVDVYEDAKLVVDNKGWGGPKRESYINTCLDFLEQKVGEALGLIRSLDMDDYNKDYSHIVVAKDNLFMLLIDSAR